MAAPSPTRDVKTRVSEPQASIAAFSPTQFRDALDIPASSFVSASLGASDENGAAIMSSVLNVAPTKGGSFLVLSTGLASDASLPNDSGSHSGRLYGLVNDQGQDMVQLRLELKPPANAKSLAFDAVFLSEEFPEYVGSVYNDAFTAEMGQTQLSIVNNGVFSPYNFAYDPEGNTVSVNTVYDYSLETGTTFDGATPLLTVSAPIERDLQTGNVVLYLTIQDLGDSVYDSAVFVDNLRWLTTAVDPGVNQYTDTDGDGLPDLWETQGVDYDNDGQVDLNLPAMGANPKRKDVFIEIDWMEKPPTTLLWGWKVGGHHHQPKPAALQKVVDAFKNAPVSNPDGSTGISAHIDAGPDSVMNPATGAKWGGMSRSASLTEVANLGKKASSGWYDWSEFDAIKANNFELSRTDVFHYCIFAHRYGEGASSGISRGIPGSDLIVADGCGSTDNLGVVEQAGTLMHEFGHNLGLGHGGGDHVNYKPNYLSIMNYSFQFSGLIKNGAFGTLDYSRAKLSDLNEGSLDEHAGLDPDSAASGFGTIFYSPSILGSFTKRQVDNAMSGVDWDWNGSLGSGVSRDINKDSSIDTLSGHDDWKNIRFDGGAVGMLGDTPELDIESEIIEPPYQEFVDNDLVLTEYVVRVKGAGVVTVLPGAGKKTVQFQVRNMGTKADSYKLSVAGFSGVDASAVPATVAVAPGATVKVNVGLTLPASTPTGDVGRIRLTAVSVKNPALSDQAEVLVEAKNGITTVGLSTKSAKIGYAAPTKIKGVLRGPAGALGGRTVKLQKYASGWKDTGASMVTLSAGTFEFTVAPKSKTSYRVTFGGTSEYLSSRSIPVTFTPKAALSKVTASRVGVRRYTLKGTLKPKHAKGTKPVRIYLSREVKKGKWKSYGYVKAKASNYKGNTLYKITYKFPKKGKWRMRAQHADAGHAKTKTAYTYVKVR